MLSSPTNKSVLRKLVIGTAIVCFVLGLVLSLLLIQLSPVSERWLLSALREHYHTAVSVRTFHVTLYPHVAISGEGLAFGDKPGDGLPPLASVERFSLEATWLGLLLHPRRVRHVRLERLAINVVSGQNHGPFASRKKHLPPIYLEDVEADGTVLTTFPQDQQKPPRVFAFSQLRLQSVGVGKPMSFQAVLTNPKPVGEIQARGEFGPWNPEDPSKTSLAGQYDFHDADLSTIHGIAGILSSAGKFAGRLDRFEVDGNTDTPQFALGRGRNSESLKTQFHAIVDGTTGETLLQPVRAELGHSTIVARGGVLRKKGVKGTRVVLDVTADRARLGDLLLIAVKSSQPPMTGPVSIQTSFEVVPGPEDIDLRLRLNGNFSIQAAQFSSPAVEEKVTHLSKSARGKPEEADQGVPSNFAGKFNLARGVMSFSQLTFTVPGASVNLHGTYDLTNETIDFLGTAQLQAEVSQMTTGFKSILLKPLDPLLKGKDAGTVLPLKISGNRQHPHFGVQMGKLWKEII